MPAAQRRHDLLVVPQPEPDQQRWSADSTAFVHAIHGAASVRFPTTGTPSRDRGLLRITYPGILNDCQTCHLPGTFDFSATPSAALSSRPFRTVVRAPTAPRSAFRRTSRWATNYGSGFSFNATTGVTTEAAPTTLVMSPTWRPAPPATTRPTPSRT